MKKITLWMALLFSFQAYAQGYYQGIPHRSNDPFVFCTKGLVNSPNDRQFPCWWPTPPYLGATYQMGGWCDPPNPHGISWTDNEWSALWYYQQVCSKTENSGSWRPEGGDSTGEWTPSQH